MNKTTRGFTLIELLIVIVVIAILAAISVVTYNGVQNRAEATKTSATVSQYIKLIEMYRVDHGVFPSSHVDPNGEICLGAPADYPADGDMPAGYCLYDVDYDGWKLSSSAVLSNQLKQYGTLPKPPLKIAEWGTERWRGVRYREAVHVGKQFAEIAWLVHGANEDYCSVPGVSAYSSTVDGLTSCWVVLWAD